MRGNEHSHSRHSQASRIVTRARAIRGSLIPWQNESPNNKPPTGQRARDLIRAVFPTTTTKLIVKPEWNDLENPATRQPCCIVADASSSMYGYPVDKLNIGLRKLGEFVRQHPIVARSAEISVIRVGDPLEVAVPYTPAAHFHPPTLRARGGTPLAEGIAMAIRLAEDRLKQYDRYDFDYFRPWILVISDGEANPSNAIPEAIRQVHRVEQARLMRVFAVGTNRKATSHLQRFSVRPTVELSDFDFESLFRWTSEEWIKVSLSMPGDEPDEPDMSRADWRKR